MSEPLRKFLEREFKGETLEEIFNKLKEGGASEIEDLYDLTDEDFAEMEIKTI